MEPVEVTARFGKDGKIYPERFVWQGKSLRVEGVGRRWEQDGALHILVMAREGQVFELVFRPAAGKWEIRASGTGAGLA